MPSRLREEKVGMSGLPTDITLRLPEAVGGEGRIWRGQVEDLLNLCSHFFSRYLKKVKVGRNSAR